MRNIMISGVVVLLFVIGASVLYAQDAPEPTLAEIAAIGEVMVDFAVVNQDAAGLSLSELSAQGVVTLGSDDWGRKWGTTACEQFGSFSDLAVQGAIIHQAPGWVCRVFDAADELAQLEAAGLITVARPS